MRWLAPDDERDESGAKKEKKGLAAMLDRSDHAAARRAREDAAKTREALREARAGRLARLLALPDGPDSLKSGTLGGLWSLLDSVDDGERRKAQAAVARIMRAVAARGEPGRDEDAFLWSGGECPPEAFVEALIGVSDRRFPDRDDAVAVEAGWSADLARRRRAASLVNACHLACAGFAASALSGACFESVVPVVELCGSRDALAERLGAEVLSCAASTESGRGLLAPLVEAGVLERLMEDGGSTAVRSAAAAAVAKMGLAAKALKSGARETGRLLDAATALLKDAAGGSTGDDPSAAERAVEVLAALSGHSSAKEELAHGSGRTGAALEALCGLGKAVRGSDPVAYGLALLFANLTVTNDELRRRHFREREMEITSARRAVLFF